VLINSNGFSGYHRGSQRWGMADVSLRDGEDRRPSGWAAAGSRSVAGLPSPESVAREAVASAEARVGGAPIETATLPVIVESRAVGRLLRTLLGPLDGRALQQRASFLEGMRDHLVGSALLDITDDPFIAGGFSSRLFDGEGIASRRLPLFEAGRLRNYYIDTYYGRKLGEAPTTGSGSNIVVTPGAGDLASLVADVERGLLVRGFIGGSSNATTGDFSLGVYGTLIEKGRLSRAVAEMNVSGNHRDLWTRLEAVGGDVYPYSSILTPSLRFEALQLSGK
jgi:PmbA protein